MMPILLEYEKVRLVKSPSFGTPDSAGLDFYLPERDEDYLIRPKEHLFVPSGICVRLPRDFVLVGFNKSSIPVKYGLLVGACVIDSDYRGEIHLHLINVSDTLVTLKPGQKAVQFLLLPKQAIALHETDGIFQERTVRGHGAFGSTGV